MATVGPWPIKVGGACIGTNTLMRLTSHEKMANANHDTTFEKIENPLPELLTRLTSQESSFGVSNVHFEFICGGISLKFEYPPKQATTLTIILQFENILKYLNI